MSTTTRVPPEGGRIDLAGDAPKWIWAFTCPTPEDSPTLAVLCERGGDPVNEAQRSGTKDLLARIKRTTARRGDAR